MDEKPMFRRVVVPLDGSDTAERALPAATEMARLLDAPLVLLRVIDLGRLERAGAYGLAIESAAFDALVAEERAASRDYLELTEADLKHTGLATATEQREGSAVREILAATRPGDLLVMASHGRSGIARWFLGSVAEEVVRRATVPVLLVRTLLAAGDGPAPEAR